MSDSTRVVHGAFADGTSWSKVIPLVTAAGYRVTSVQNPLTSFQDDVAAVKRAIGTQDGPANLVGHSYGGVVITEAGNDPKVAGLVYVAAFAPGAQQNSPPFSPRPLLLLSARSPPEPLGNTSRRATSLPRRATSSRRSSRLRWLNALELR